MVVRPSSVWWLVRAVSSRIGVVQWSRGRERVCRLKLRSRLLPHCWWQAFVSFRSVVIGRCCGLLRAEWWLVDWLWTDCWTGIYYLIGRDSCTTWLIGEIWFIYVRLLFGSVGRGKGSFARFKLYFTICLCLQASLRLQDMYQAFILVVDIDKYTTSIRILINKSWSIF